MLAKGGFDMNDKRTQQLNIRITPELEKVLIEEGNRLDWSKTKLAEKILMDWAQKRHEHGGAINFIQNNIENVHFH